MMGSKDKTLERNKEIQKELDNKIRYVSFSRNFGKEAAMLAGLDYSTGDFYHINGCRFTKIHHHY